MICTTEDIRGIRPIANNIGNERIECYIEEVEQLQVMPTIGVELYKKISDNREAFADLINGCYYDSDKKWNAGLISAIAYLVYARFLRNQNMNVTAFGAVLKNGQLSQKVDDATLTRMVNEAQSIGENYLSTVIDYARSEGLLSCDKSVFKRNFKVIGD
jgi:hypothetical protein